MSKQILIILAICMYFVACRKNSITEIEACRIQTGNPDRQSYTSSDLYNYLCTEKHCGLLPLSQKNYWIYLDSVYDNGVFQRTKLDTLRFDKNYRTQPDGLVWWETTTNVGLPLICYANDSSIFGLQPRLFTSYTILDARKEIYQFDQDSLHYLTSFGDEAAAGRAAHSEYTTPAGNFNDCLLFEKYAKMYRRDRVYLQPGIGVVKYIHEEAPLGGNVIEIQQTSTLIGYHLQ